MHVQSGFWSLQQRSDEQHHFSKFTASSRGTNLPWALLAPRDKNKQVYHNIIISQLMIQPLVPGQTAAMLLFRSG